jgi:hypothetical protein
MFIKFKNGSTWQLVGSDNYNALVGSPPVGVVFSEYALADPRAWGYISPILEENNGWAVFIYTPRGNNHGKTMVDFAKTAPGWFGQILTADDTNVFTQEQLANIKRELIATAGYQEGESLFLQEYYCSFEGYAQGAYYAKQLREAKTAKRICNVPWVSDQEVYTFWDLGIDDSTTIWFMQAIGKELRFIDYYENVGEGLQHYAKVLKEKPYSYGEHYMPHDVEARELGTGKARREVAEGMGIKPIVTVKRAKDSTAVLEGIEQGRNILNRCWFDETKCARGLSALESYHAEYDDDRKKLNNKPEHDWTSHAADAFRTFSVGYVPGVLLITMKENKDQQDFSMQSWLNGGA